MSVSHDEEKNQKLARMKELIRTLNEAARVYYVDGNDSTAQTITLRDGDTAAYDKIAGKVVAKTPLIGYLSQLCFSVAGIVVTVLIFAAGLGMMMYANKIGKEINDDHYGQKRIISD